MADALINPVYLTIGRIDTTTTTLHMVSGTHVKILNSLRAAFGYDQRIELLGALGMAQAGNVVQSTVTVSLPNGITAATPLRNYPQRYAKAYQSEIMQFVSAALAEKPVSPHAFDGLRASEIAKAAIESMQSAQPVQISSLS